MRTVWRKSREIHFFHKVLRSIQHAFIQGVASWDCRGAQTALTYASSLYKMVLVDSHMPHCIWQLREKQINMSTQ